MLRNKPFFSWISFWGLLVGVCAGVEAQEPSVPTAPAFEPPALQHSLLDFLTGKPVAMKMKELFTPKLMRPPFAGAPINTPKGLAAKIKAQQVDARNRAAAVQFLGTVDCVAHPEARDMLVQVLQEDPSERVRLAAAEALQEMLARGPQRERRGFMDRMGDLFDGETRREEARRYDACLGCCDAEVLNALSEIAYGRDETGCYIEPSERVREALQEAMDLCADCYPAAAEPVEPTPTEQPEEAPPAAPGEEPPAEGPAEDTAGRATHHASAHAATPPPPVVTAQFLQQQAARSENPPIVTLSGYCIVGLKERQFVKARTDLSAVHQGRTYYFASEEARRRFEENPKKYAVAYGGMDPVHYAQTGEAAYGFYLREYEGRFYLFRSKENWRLFQEHPRQFLPVTIHLAPGKSGPSSGTRLAQQAFEEE